MKRTIAADLKSDGNNEFNNSDQLLEMRLFQVIQTLFTWSALDIDVVFVESRADDARKYSILVYTGWNYWRHCH